MWNHVLNSVRRLQTHALHTTGVRALQMGVAAVILYRVFTELPFAGYFWGPDGVGKSDFTARFGPHIGAAINGLFAQSWGAYLVLVLMCAAGLALIAGRFTRAATVLALVTVWLLGMRNDMLADGGDNVIRIVLFYMLLFLPPGARVPERPSLRVWLHNIGVVAVIAQILVIYAVSGTSKVMGELWTNGTAMYYIAQVDWFSTPYFRELFKNAWIAPLAAYATIVYQIAFPFLALSRYRLPLFAIGIFFHLGIAVMMGLITFSTIMIALELFLIPNRDYLWMRQGAAQLWRRLQGRFPVLVRLGGAA